MPQPVLTEKLMTEILMERALKICQLSLEITTRELAQASTDIQGLVNTFEAKIRTVDAPAADSKPELARLHMRLYHYDFHYGQEKEKDFSERLTEADRYIAYLNLILAKGKPVTMADLRGAA